MRTLSTLSRTAANTQRPFDTSSGSRAGSSGWRDGGERRATASAPQSPGSMITAHVSLVEAGLPPAAPAGGCDHGHSVGDSPGEASSAWSNALALRQ
jgi:hypothetical protein